ncbi:MAG TPA: DUF2330 domain-containing protein [Chitinophagaceae bacterium]|nr:DUF2330 domain-containing protein [Chitinophagaceae bacterium]
MQLKTYTADPRYFQIFFQLLFLCYGLLYLSWPAEWTHYFISIGSCLFFNWCFESIQQKTWLPLRGSRGWRLWGFSVMISAASLCLLLKTGHPSTSLLAAFLTVASKYLFRIGGKHIFNPSAFGIVATLWLTGDAWLSPAQWGTGAVIFFFVLTLGFIVVTRVQKLDVSLAFLLTFIGAVYWRQVYVLHWPLDHFVHSVSTGSLLLFSFFMISDPKTSPAHPTARTIWAILIALVAFYFAAFKWKYNTAIWVLVAAAPLVPLLNFIFKRESFTWTASPLLLPLPLTLKKINMKPFFKKLAASFMLLVMISGDVLAFCGFYVSKADGTLKNKTSQVILARDGDRNVITMYNDFKGNFKDFAMVVPVPVVLKKGDIKVVDGQIFSTLNDYSQPRLVEYYDQNPCNRVRYDNLDQMSMNAIKEVITADVKTQRKKSLGVKVEAKYLVGEYDILILSAKESAGLKTWLEENGYKIPAGADEVLEPYVKSNLKFFVVKVNEEALRKTGGNFLRPLQISFTSPKFMLPIRLGMANADGDQDMIIYGFTKKGRIECTNYRTVSIPTGSKVPLFVQNNFGNFYANLFHHQWKREGKAVAMLEYAWDVSPKNFLKCDPCVATAPSTQDLAQAGVWWITRDWNDYSDVDSDIEDYSDNVYFTRLHVRYNRNSFPQDLQFQVTPQTENFQARYVITHPATGDFNCDAGRKYLKALKQRRQDELATLASLTGKGYEDWDVVIKPRAEEYIPANASYEAVATMKEESWKGKNVLILACGMLGILSFVSISRKKPL